MRKVQRIDGRTVPAHEGDFFTGALCAIAASAVIIASVLFAILAVTK